MINCSPKTIRAETPQKLEGSMFSDISRQSYLRLERKNSNNSARSRESSGSVENRNQNSSFYLKNIYSTPQRQSLRDQPRQVEDGKKKRVPTPSKSRRQMRGYIENIESKDHIKLKAIQNQIKIQELQTNTRQLKVKQRQLERRWKLQQQKVFKLEDNILKKDKRISQLLREQSEVKKKMSELQRSIEQSEYNLQSANSNLDRLRKAIKDNRVSDLKKQIQEQNTELECRFTKIKKLTEELQKANQKIKKIQKQNQNLKNRLQIQNNSKVQSMREKFLQKEVVKLKQQLLYGKKGDDNTAIDDQVHILERKYQTLESEKKRMMIQLDYLNRKHMEQFKIFNKSKNEEIQILEKKYIFLQKKYYDLRNQFYKNGRNSSLIKNGFHQQKPSPIRESMMESNHTRKRNHSLSFQLSPQ